MRPFFTDLHLLTYNYEAHDLDCLSAFPDSTSFYSMNWPLPEGIISFLYIATCNRIEIYLQTDNNSEKPYKVEDLIEILKSAPFADKFSQYRPHHITGRNAIRHLFQMMAGLRSMAVGETQITGQVKRDVARAEDNNYLSPFFKSLVQKGFEVQKLVRTETEVGRNPISLLSLMEREILNRTDRESLEINRVVLGGTGDMARKTLNFLVSRGVKEIEVVRHTLNAPIPEPFQRTLKRYPSLKVSYHTWGHLPHHKNFNADLFIGATNSGEPLVSAEEIRNHEKTGYLKPDCFLVDLGIPANFDIDSDAELLRRFVNLNALLQQSRGNQSLRRKHMHEALPLIEKGVYSFWMDHIYRTNPDFVNEVLLRAREDRQRDWEALLNGPLADINAKQKRILHDHLVKQERKTLRTHKKLFIEMLVNGQNRNDRNGI